jgi:hypothetical protein
MSCTEGALQHAQWCVWCQVLEVLEVPWRRGRLPEQDFVCCRRVRWGLGVGGLTLYSSGIQVCVVVRQVVSFCFIRRGISAQLARH